MQNFAIVTCKHNTIPLVLKLAKESVDKIAADPKTAHFMIHTFLLTPAVEMPESNLALVGQNPGQPQMVMYVTILLVAPGAAAPQLQAVAGGALKSLSSVPLSDDDLKEIDQIQQAKKVFCKHENLQPERLYKGYRGPDHWYQICADCGAEIWNDRFKEYNQHPVNGRMVPYENHPGDCTHEHLADLQLIRKDKGGHYGIFKTCNDCGGEVYQGLPSPSQVQQLVDAELKGMELIQLPIDPIGEQVNEMP